MADRYLVPGGNGVYSSSTNWSATSGGSSGASAPVTTDKIFADANSAGAAITLGANGACLAFDFTGYTGTFGLSNKTLTVSGTTQDCKFSATMTLTSSFGTISFTGTSGTISLYFAGIGITSSNNVYIGRAGIGGTLSILSAPSDGGGVWLTITGGTLDINISLPVRYMQQSGASTRALILGASATISGSSPSAVSSTIFTSSGSYTPTINASATIAVETIDMFASITIPCNVDIKYFATNNGKVLTIEGDFTCVGTATKYAELMHSILHGSGYADDTGYPTAIPKIICNGTVTLDYVLIREVEFAGTAVWECDTAVDLGRSIGFTFLPSTTLEYYWVGGSGSTNDAAHWSLTSGGAGGAGIPYAGCIAHFDDAGLSNGNTITWARSGGYYGCGFGILFGSFDFSDLTKTITLSVVNSYHITFGDFTASETITWSGNSAYIYFCAGGFDTSISLSGTNLLAGGRIIEVIGSPTSTVHFLDAVVGTYAGSSSFYWDDGGLDLSNITFSVPTVRAGVLHNRQNYDESDYVFGLYGDFTNLIAIASNQFALTGGTNNVNPYAATVVGSETMTIACDAFTDNIIPAWNGDDPDGVIIGRFEIRTTLDDFFTPTLYVLPGHKTQILYFHTGPDFEWYFVVRSDAQRDYSPSNPAEAELHLAYVDARVPADWVDYWHYGYIIGVNTGQPYQKMLWYIINDPVTFSGVGFEEVKAANANEFFSVDPGGDLNDWGGNVNITFGKAGPYYPPMMSGMGIV